MALERDGMVLLVVADGMGGHELGGEAAEAAIDRFVDLFQTSSPSQDPAAFLATAMQEAHKSVYTIGQDMPIEFRPRTTCVAALLIPPNAWVAHVGDSRAYVFREDEMVLRTLDHSHVEDLISAGQLAEENRAHHPLRNLVERCCGGDLEPVETEFNGPIELSTGDVVLLCSDGFWEGLKMTDVARVMRESDDPARTLDELAQIACKLGSPQADNATAAALRVESE